MTKSTGVREALRQEKDRCRQNISALAMEIKRVTNGGKIPQRIVEANHQDTVAWKDLVESSSAVYHVQHPPGRSHTVADLKAIEDRLTLLLKALA